MCLHVQVVESLYGQDLDSGHHGSGFPLPPFRQALLEQHLAQQAAALREKSGHEAVEVSLPPRRFTPEEEEYSLHAWNINNLPRNRVHPFWARKPFFYVFIFWCLVRPCSIVCLPGLL